MSKATQGLADDMERAHATLLRDLREASDLARGPKRDNAAAWRERLAALQAHVGEHFRYEEENGYMTEVLKRKPNQERVVAILLDEHRQLAQSLANLLTTLDGPKGADNSWLEKAQSWLDAVRKHEFRENDLVQDAFNLDLSAED